jgi:hypothetical protein
MTRDENIKIQNNRKISFLSRLKRTEIASEIHLFLKYYRTFFYYSSLLHQSNQNCLLDLLLGLEKITVIHSLTTHFFRSVALRDNEHTNFLSNK